MGLLWTLVRPGQQRRYVTNLKSVANDEYDVIIVGGGTAGCVLASRLSENPEIRVLLLESGVSGRSLLLTRVPVGFSLLFGSKHVHNLNTEPQTFAHKHTKYWPRGNVLGGCSSINAQMAQYGAPGDFDEWASIIQDESWSWKNFSRYFQKFEKYIPDPEKPLVEHIASKGSQGPVKVGYFSYISQPSLDFIKSCVACQIPESSDFNGPLGTRGVNRIPTYIDEKRERVSSESAYFTKDVLSRKNLTIVTGARVSKILTQKTRTEIRATGVEFSHKAGGETYRAFARNEIIISSGAVHSPQILLLSGIGPTAVIQPHGIPVIHDLPGVGANLVDHPVVDVYFKDKLNASPKHVIPKSVPEVFQAIGSVIQYLGKRRGPLAMNFGESAAFVRSDDPKLFADAADLSLKIQDSTSSPDSPDLEIFTTPFAYKNHGQYIFPMHTFSIHACLLRPLSRGSLTLRSDSAWDQPVVDPRYLENQDDVEKLKLGIKLIFKIARTEPLASRLDHDNTHPDLDHLTYLKTNEELEEIVRERVETLYHPASTCRMAPREDGGVVDSQLRVYGVKGLRVCDASIFPVIVSGHTAGAVFAIAEKLSDMLKAEWADGKS